MCFGASVNFVKVLSLSYKCPHEYMMVYMGDGTMEDIFIADKDNFYKTYSNSFTRC